MCKKCVSWWVNRCPLAIFRRNNATEKLCAGFNISLTADTWWILSGLVCWCYALTLNECHLKVLHLQSCLSEQPTALLSLSPAHGNHTSRKEPLLLRLRCFLNATNPSFFAHLSCSFPVNFTCLSKPDTVWYRGDHDRVPFSPSMSSLSYFNCFNNFSTFSIQSKKTCI